VSPYAPLGAIRTDDDDDDDDDEGFMFNILENIPQGLLKES